MVNLPTDGSIGDRNDLKHLIREVADLKAQVARMASSASQFERMTIGKGGIIVKQPGDITIIDDDGATIWDALLSPTQTQTFSEQVDVTVTDTPTWNDLATINAPDGFTRFLMFYVTSIDCAFSTTSGNLLQIQPATTVYGPGQLPEGTSVGAYGGTTAGPGSTLFTSGSGTFNWEGMESGTYVKVQAAVSKSGTTSDDGHIHVNGFVLWQR